MLVLSRRFYALIIVVLFGLCAFQLWFHATRTSATIDEPVHILAGYLHWCGDFGFNPEHPPLLKMLATAPLIGKDLVQPPWDCGSRVTSRGDSYFFGNAFLVANGPDKVVIPARLAATSMSLLLALLVFLAASEMVGRSAGLTALALLVFEPNLIAHGSLVTTDMAVTVGLFAAVYALYRYLKSPTMLRLLTVGLAVGLTLAVKHSGVLILPIIALLLLCHLLISRSRGPQNRPLLAKQFLRHVAAAAGFFSVGLGLLWAAYGFRYYALPNAIAHTVSVEDRLGNSRSGHVMTLINQTRILPESYLYGLVDIAATGFPTSIFDHLYPTGKWFYFPLAFAVKTSTALLVLLAVGLLSFRLYREHGRNVVLAVDASRLFCRFTVVAYQHWCSTSSTRLSFYNRHCRCRNLVLESKIPSGQNIF